MEMLRIVGNLEEIEAAYQAQHGKLEAEKLLVIKLGMAGTHTTREIAHLLKQSEAVGPSHVGSRPFEKAAFRPCS